jgi:meso-butanediol dehydrogenase / (S,S)-butanediol dehydrogenase / diacetyl reductase
MSVVQGDKMNFTGQVALITGAASGMGAATAREFAAAGAQVVIVDRNGPVAEQIAREIGAGAPIVGDVRQSSFCNQAVQTALERHGRLDVLVNCAGIIVRASATGTNDEQWRDIMGVNLDGVFFMSRAAITPMKQQGSGAIINFGSIWGSVGGEGHVAYCATKGAVHQLTRAMALDHARDGIRINAVAPGEVDTPMLASGRPTPPSRAELDRMADEVVPMGRLAQPVEIARVVLFLASEAASYMTGAIVPVDAGYTTK